MDVLCWSRWCRQGHAPAVVNLALAMLLVLAPGNSLLTLLSVALPCFLSLSLPLSSLPSAPSPSAPPLPPLLSICSCSVHSPTCLASRLR